MKTCCFILKFITPVGTPLKGDTLFGRICWEIAYDRTLFNKSIEELVEEYNDKPYCIVSSGFPVIKTNDKYTLVFRAPSLPPEKLFAGQIRDVKEYMKERKKFKKKRWMILEGAAGSLKNANYYTDDEVIKLLPGQQIGGILKEFAYIHNSIQRTSYTTSAEGFAPYSVYNFCFHPELYTGVIICTDKEFLNSIEEALRRIGRSGFGRDASAGLGKFEVIEYFDLDLKAMGSKEPNALYTLAPTVINPDDFKDCYYIPFIRYGRHGDILAKARNPFKNPVVMLDEGAVLVSQNRQLFDRPYIGISLKGVSIALETTVHQGYSPYIPVLLEEEDV